MEVGGGAEQRQLINAEYRKYETFAEDCIIAGEDQTISQESLYMEKEKKEEIKEKNILLFQMSMLKTKNDVPVNHYFYEEPDQTMGGTIRFHFDGQSQLEPGTKHLIYKLAGERKKIDRIIVLNTEETIKTGDDNPVSAFDYYCEKMNKFWEMIRNTPEIESQEEIEIKEEIKTNLNDALIEKWIPKKTMDALCGFKNADKDSSDSDKNGLIKAIETSIHAAIQEQIGNESAEKKKNIIEFKMLEDIVVKLDKKIKKDIENRFNEMSGLDSFDGYNGFENSIKEEIDAVPVDQLEKMELAELFQRFQKYAVEAESIGKAGKQFLKREDREIWYRYLLSKLSYYYKKECYEKKEIREQAEKKARILEQQSDYYKNNIRQHLTTFIREYAYHYCLEKELLLCEDKQKMQARKLLVRETYFPKETLNKCGQEAASQIQRSPIQIDTVNIVNEDLNSALFELKNCLDTIQKNEELDRLNIYIDMQGGDRSGAFVFSSVLKLIDSKKMIVQEQFATNFVPQRIAHRVVDKTKQYAVEKLSSGMNAFLRYGRADELCDYLNDMDPNGKNKDFVETIQKLGNAISICNPEAFEKELENIGNYISAAKIENAKNENNSESKKTVFDLLIGEFEREFASLLKEDADVLDRIKWFLDKGFTQQALTYIEAKMPDYIATRFVEYQLYKNGQRVSDSNIYEIRNSLDGKNYESENDIFVNRTFEKNLRTWKKQQNNEKKKKGCSFNSQLVKLLKKCRCISNNNPTEDVIKRCILHYCDDPNNKEMTDEPQIQYIKVGEWIDRKKAEVSVEESEKIRSIEANYNEKMNNINNQSNLIGIQELYQLLTDKNWTLECISFEVDLVQQFGKWCKDYLVARSIDILCDNASPDDAIESESDFWGRLKRGIRGSELGAAFDKYRVSYNKWKGLYDNPTIERSMNDCEEAFIGFRSMMGDWWAKKELDHPDDACYFKTGSFSQRSLKDFFSINPDKPFKGDEYYRLILGSIPDNVIEVIKSGNSVDLPLENENEKNDERYLRMTLLIDDDKKEMLRKFFRLHSSFRKERNSTNHASETDARTPYEILNDMIRLYIDYARDLTPASTSQDAAELHETP